MISQMKGAAGAAQNSAGAVPDWLRELRKQVREELEGNILPFWLDRMQDDEAGGFLGRISGEGLADPTAEKGAILNARILWMFSSAYRILGDKRCLDAATRAKREIIDKFYDHQFGGVYWAIKPGSQGAGSDSVPGGLPGYVADAKKQIYALGFAIYGLAEYNRVTGDEEALQYAVRLFEDIENHSFDAAKDGYFEAFNRDWSPIQDMRLSDKDRNDCKTMNTHLHILEPYTELYRVWKSPRLEKQLRGLINLFTDRILDPETGHLRLFFDEDWHHTDSMVSYGHDIEASWLLWEAAEVLGDPQVKERLRPIVEQIAAAAAEGYVREGGMLYEFDRESGRLDADRHWWVQAETVVGYLNLWKMTSDGAALDKVLDCWNFTRRHIVDREGGEWFWSLKADGTPNRADDKAGFWKCPYHNGRMCMELIERLAEFA